MKYRCPCCDYYTLPEVGAHEICPVCFWHDDGERLSDLNHPRGPNGVNLARARKNFIVFGASEKRVLPHVRPPMNDEKEGFETFLFQEKRHTAAITCCHVMKNNQAIRYASHDEDDGMWQFLCWGPHELDEVMLVSLYEIYQHDPSIATVANLPFGYEAERKDKHSEWLVHPQ